MGPLWNTRPPAPMFRSTCRPKSSRESCMRITHVAISILSLALGVGSAARAQAPKNAPASPDSFIVAAERAIWELLKKQQWDAFDAAVAGETMLDASGISVARRGGTAPGLPGLVTKSFTLDSIRVRSITPDVALVTYKASVDQTMKGAHVPSPYYMLSIWQRKDGKWGPVAHAETAASTAK